MDKLQWLKPLKPLGLKFLERGEFRISLLKLFNVRVLMLSAFKLGILLYIL